MKPSALSAWKKTATAAALGAALSFVPMKEAFSQTGPVAANTNKSKTETVTAKEPVVQVKDLRKHSPQAAAHVAYTNSQNGYVVVLVWGCEQHVIDAVEGAMKSLMWAGRTKIGMVISNMTNEKADKPQIAIVSKGDFSARIFDPSGTTRTWAMVSEFVAEAYDRDIGKPKPVTASASLKPEPQEP